MLFIALLALLPACKKEGCVDSKALNYNAEAKKDDGSCTYKKGCTDRLADNYDEMAHTDDGTCSYDNKGFVKINFKARFNNADLLENTTHTNVTNVALNFSLLKTYLSSVKVRNTAGTYTTLSDVVLVDFFDNADLTHVFALPEGSYTHTSFITGLTPSQNATDPSSLGSENPLSVYSNMYWNWATRYIFYKIEGTYDSNNDPSVLESAFIYHIGSDALADSIALSKTFSVLKKDTTEVSIYLNMDQFFYRPTDTLDVIVDHTTQTVDNMNLAKRVAKLFPNAFSMP